MRAFWFDQFPNFGDALTPWLLARAGFMPRLSTARDAQLIGVGSLLEMVPRDYAGAVWGSGLLQGRSVPLPYAKYLAVRGVLTMETQGLERDIALGDPGLLVSKFLPKRRPSVELGIIPHHAQKTANIWEELQQASPGSLLIDPVGSPTKVIGEISRCKRILTSSLHGLITADAYGIPASWVELPTQTLAGGAFKFRDYESVVLPSRNRRLVAESATQVLGQIDEKASTVDAEIVRDTQDQLLRALTNAPHTVSRPWTSW
ncbi:polysaccharide pyruvyl transferase family protein [Ornithinimicrobium flavum]|uniref:polysaccharide pyruvyl transferase family protein n=1 Tax=Ornithinimicrobium flavum TaxID=1288636 RepID=UPI001EE849A7|nr:polysaccharide pyruvyl transferase family protein [Ornithinimicrobium flavum]